MTVQDLLDELAELDPTAEVHASIIGASTIELTVGSNLLGTLDA